MAAFVHIYKDEEPVSAFRRTIPYIYNKEEQKWVKSKAYIYTNGEWVLAGNVNGISWEEEVATMGFYLKNQTTDESSDYLLVDSNGKIIVMKLDE